MTSQCLIHITCSSEACSEAVSAKEQQPPCRQGCHCLSEARFAACLFQRISNYSTSTKHTKHFLLHVSEKKIHMLAKQRKLLFLKPSSNLARDPPHNSLYRKHTPQCLQNLHSVSKSLLKLGSACLRYSRFRFRLHVVGQSHNFVLQPLSQGEFPATACHSFEILVCSEPTCLSFDVAVRSAPACPCYDVAASCHTSF